LLSRLLLWSSLRPMMMMMIIINLMMQISSRPPPLYGRVERAFFGAYFSEKTVCMFSHALVCVRVYFSAPRGSLCRKTERELVCDDDSAAQV